MDFMDINSFVELFPTEIVTIRNLMNFGCLRRTVSCPVCEDEMKLVLTDKKKVLRYRRKSFGKRELRVVSEVCFLEACYLVGRS